MPETILATENPLKIMKNAFFILEALFVLKKFKQLDYKDKINFKIYDVTTWETSNCNTHIVQCLNK